MVTKAKPKTVKGLTINVRIMLKTAFPFVKVKLRSNPYYAVKF